MRYTKRVVHRLEVSAIDLPSSGNFHHGEGVSASFCWCLSPVSLMQKMLSTIYFIPLKFIRIFNVPRFSCILFIMLCSDYRWHI